MNVLNVLKVLGIGYNKVKQTGPKIGEIPKIDIEMVEFNIKQLESLNENPNEMGLDEIQILSDFYQKAIEFYSATNNPLYENHLTKLTNLMKISAEKKKKIEEKDNKKLQQITENKTNKPKNHEKIQISEKITKENEINIEETKNIEKKENEKLPEIDKNKENSKKEVHYTNQDGIVIDHSDLPNFDDGNESEESD